MKLIVKKLFLFVLCGIFVYSAAACGAVKPNKQSSSSAEESFAPNEVSDEDSFYQSKPIESESSAESEEQSGVEKDDDTFRCGDFGYILAEGVAQLCAYYGEETELDVPQELDGYTVTAVNQSAFGKNDTLTQINVGNSVVNIAEYAFSGCSALKKVNIGNGVAVVHANSFDNCPSLEEIEVTAANSSYTSVEGVLYTDDKSRLVRCPQGFKTEEFSVPADTSLVGNGAFRKCGGIQAVVLPAECALSANAFFHCDNMQSFSFEGTVTDIPDYCFFGCVLLEEIMLPNGVEALGEYAFFGCVGLREISIPATVTAIAQTAFECCTGIEEASVAGDCATQWYKDYQQQ